MALTRAQMRSLVASNLGGRTDLDSNINTWLNWSLRDVQRRHRWGTLENESTLDLVASQKTYNLDATLQTLLTVRISDYDSDDDEYTSSREMIVISPAEMDMLVPRAEQDAAGRPDYAIWFGKQLSFYRIPDSTARRITYRWKKKITEFANDSATASIADIDDILVARASWYGQMMLEETEMAAFYRAMYETGMKEAMREDRKIPVRRDVPQPVGGRGQIQGSVDDPFYCNPRRRWR